MKCLPILAGWLVAAAPTQAAPVNADHGNAAAKLQLLLEKAIAKGIPGISAAIATRNGVVWTGVAGKADLQTGAPVRADMLFGIGSITKTFVAVVILQLAEEGRLDRRPLIRWRASGNLSSRP